MHTCLGSKIYILLVYILPRGVSMKTEKMLFSFLLVGVLTVAVVASGCIGGETTTQTTTVEQITLKVIGPWSGAELDAFNEVIKAFEAEHPDIKVEY
ncbi:ABC transporter substrate-binding protein, partial [Thermococci archaeon]